MFALKSRVPVNALVVSEDIDIVALTVTVPPPEFPSNIATSLDVGTFVAPGQPAPAPPVVVDHEVKLEPSHVAVPPTQKQFTAFAGAGRNAARRRERPISLLRHIAQLPHYFDEYEIVTPVAALALSLSASPAVRQKPIPLAYASPNGPSGTATPPLLGGTGYVANTVSELHVGAVALSYVLR